MTNLLQTVKKRKYIEGKNESLNTVLEIEKKYFKQILWGATNENICTKGFTPNGLVEIEKNILGVLMFRFETEIDSPKTLILSLFFLALKAYNVRSSTKSALETIYKDPIIENIMGMIDLCDYIEEKVSVLGVCNMISIGTNCLLSCVQQGNVYDAIKQQIYANLILRDLLLEPDWEPRNGQLQYLYVIFIYKKVEHKMDFGLYIILTHLTHEKTVIDAIREKFNKERVRYLDYIASDVFNLDYFGSLQQIGYCYTDDIKTSSIDIKGVVLPVLKLERFFVSIKTKKRFI